MGCLRLVLAISVILGHSGPLAGYTIVPAQFAVVTFFILSGFYMALVVNEKYGPLPGGRRLFYENRFLRLYPVYFAVLLASIVLQLALGSESVFVNPSPALSGLQRLGYILLNLTVVGQDVASSFDTTFHQFPNHPVSIGWTIGTEALFYAIAPFIVQRRRWPLVLGLAAASLAVRVSLQGFSSDPWRYRLLPSVLVFFLMGILAYRLWERVRHWPSSPTIGRYLFWGGAAALALKIAVSGHGIANTDDLDAWQYWLCYLGTMLAAPFLFAYTGRSRLDNAIGPATYPIYIGHNFVVVLVGVGFGFGLHSSAIVVPCALAFGLLLHLSIERPLDEFRASLVQRRTASGRVARGASLPAPGPPEPVPVRERGSSDPAAGA